MNREEIIRMAREAGIGVEKDVDDWSVPVWHLGIDYLERFAALVAARTLANIDPSKFMSYREGFEVGAAAERERCAQVCDEFESEADLDAGFVLAAAIRARGNT